MTSQSEQLEVGDLNKRIISCQLCQLCEERKNAVPGDGAYETEVMFIGEGPGKDEDLQGKPFVGAAGKFLTELITSIGLKRENVFITNIVKCRPPNNRDPLLEEINACFPYLKRQIEMIKPKLIVFLGRYSMGHFLPGLKISEVHGQPKRAKGIWQERQVYLPLYHPAFALYDPSRKQTLFDDFKKIPLILKKINDAS